MNLAEQLTAIRTRSASAIPPDKLSVMQRATLELRASGILDRVIKPGAPLPPFSLANVQGQTVTSATAAGPRGLVLSIFRGHW